MKHNAGDAAWGLGEPFNTVSVADIFVALRDAVAHADERKISPINGAPDTADAGRLIGFEFHTEKFGGVPILESQMRTFGISLADEFLREMTPQKSKAA